MAREICANLWKFLWFLKPPRDPQKPVVHWLSNNGTKSEVDFYSVMQVYIRWTTLNEDELSGFFGKDKNWNLFPDIGIPPAVNDLTKLLLKAAPTNYGRKVKLYEKSTLHLAQTP